MKRAVLSLAFVLAGTLLIGPVDAASGGIRSGGGGIAGGHTGAAVPHAGGFRPTPGAGLAGRGFIRPGFGRPGFARGGIGRFGGRGEFRGGTGEFPGRRGGFGREAVIGVPAFVPGPDLLGLPFYDGFEYPYVYPGGGVPYVAPDVYGPDYLPPDGGYAPPSNYPLPPNQPAAQQIWYYCQQPMGYYPYVRECSGAWQAVPASVLPPPAPQ